MVLFTILCGNKVRGALSEPANPAMNPEEELNLRREVRATVFRLARAHHEVAPGMSLAGEFAAVQARLAALGCPDPERTLCRWRMEDEAAFDLAALVHELVAARLPPVPARPFATVVMPPPASPPSHAHPAPSSTGIPGLADLLDDMLSQERRHRPPH